MNYTTLLETLTNSYTRQSDWYEQLKVLVQKILGSIAVNRGDVASVMGLFNEKKELLEKITQEREDVKENIALWQKEKNNIPSSPATETFDTVLVRTEQVIKEFLELEDRLKKYLQTSSQKG